MTLNFSDWLNEGISEIDQFALANGVDVDIYLSSSGEIHLSRIFVPKENRKQGVGSQIMQFIVNYADKENRIITLSPSTDFGGTSINRLKNFYKNFGFVENKGRNKNYKYSSTMIRYPIKRN